MATTSVSRCIFAGERSIFVNIGTIFTQNGLRRIHVEQRKRTCESETGIKTGVGSTSTVDRIDADTNLVLDI